LIYLIFLSVKKRYVEGYTTYNAVLIVLEPPITPVPQRGNFESYDFLKAYEKCYRMSVVCTLAVGALRTYWVK
jgi:hypothetical protein